jgi:hypothetical protein
MLYTLAIQNDTGISTGKYRSDTEPVIGKSVTVNLHDQNGRLIQVSGTVVEILETKEY